MLKNKVPPRLWDYGVVWVCEVENICANLSRYADGHTPLEIIAGETPDISEYVERLRFLRLGVVQKQCRTR